MIDSKHILVGLPKGLRDSLLHSYQEIAANYTEHRWEPSELNGGKFCEIVYTIINGALSGTFPHTASKPNNMLTACRNLETIPANSHLVGDRSLRILIPRMLVVLYEVRNNRGVGHVGGDVDSNFLDATAVHGMASWVLAELVRVFHNVSTEEAQKTVDVLIERKHPLIWEVDENTRRVQDPLMKKGDQALLLLHQKPAWVPEEDLLSWVEYSSLPMFRKRILKPFHEHRLIEYDQERGRARISPLGVKKVEQQILGSRQNLQ